MRQECVTFKNHLVASGLAPSFVMATIGNLAKALGAFPRGNGPLYQQLAQAITLAVERSDLLPGTRLPPGAVPVERGRVHR